eukprot:12417618-Karenia_brevis.AAC.1
MKVDFVGGGPAEITVDSGAEEPAFPWEWGQQFGCRVVDDPLRLRNANDTIMPYWGSREIEAVSTF